MSLEALGENIFLQRHPLNLAGCRMGRMVTVIRLASGKLIIHSTANFSASDCAEISALGEPGWLVEATHFHDTCAAAGHSAFPDLPFLAPPGFPAAAKCSAQPILPAPAEWRDQLEVLELEGMPKIREHVFLHRPSKTLILADLFFNMPPSIDWWSRTFLRAFSGLKRYPGTSRLFKFYIADRDTFRQSLERIAAWDFERIVVAHGDPVLEDARGVFMNAMAAAGFDLGS